MHIKVNPKIFNSKYLPMFDKDTRYQIVFGGSSSGKSYATFSMSVLWALQGHSILILRKNQASNSKSVWLELTKAIHRMGLSNHFSINKADRTITNHLSKGCIMLNGAYPDTERLKSITPIYGESFSIIILEEATEFSEDDLNEILLRQRGKSKYKKKVIALFNPIFKKHWIYKKFFEPIEATHDFNTDATEYQSDDLWILKTTYLDNKYLEQEEIDTLEGMKITSPYHYQVYCKGNFGVLGNLCLPHFQEVDLDVQALRLDQHGILIGIDFGYTNDPTAIIFCAYSEKDRTIYIFDEIYGKGMSEEDMALKIKEKLRLYNIRYYQAYGDNSSPRAVDRLRSLGVSIDGAKGSIQDGIFWIRQNKVLVKSCCTNLLEESKLYTYKKGADGETTNEPIDKWNHGIDGLRYALVDKISNQKYIMSSKRV